MMAASIEKEENIDAIDDVLVHFFYHNVGINT